MSWCTNKNKSSMPSAIFELAHGFLESVAECHEDHRIPAAGTSHVRVSHYVLVTLPQAHVVYGANGKLNAAKDNAVLLPSHYKANFHGYEWLMGADSARSLKTFSRRDRTFWKWQLVFAEQYAGRRLIPRMRNS